MSARPLPHRILLVDDHPLVLAGMRMTLVPRFPEVRIREARTAGEALERIRHEVPDVVLLDVRLPGLSGLDLLPRLRVHRQTMRVLMIAADADPWAIDQALRGGAVGFVAKGCAGETLCLAVETVVRGERFLCDESRRALDRVAPGPGLAESAPGPAVLSPREMVVLRHLAHGDNSKMIAGTLGISSKTVDSHKQHIQRKLSLGTPAMLVRYALRHGLVQE